MEKYHFYRQNQHANESIVNYVAELCKLLYCYEFGVILDNACRDSFVHRLENGAHQKYVHVLSERDLSVDKAITPAKGMKVSEEVPDGFHS